MIFQTEKQLKEYGDKLPGDKKTVIESALEGLRSAHQSQDLGRIDSAMKALNDAWNAASEDLYKANQGASGSAQDASGSSNGSGAPSGEPETADDVTDVEFEEVDGK